MPTIFLAGDSTCATNGPSSQPCAGWGQYLGDSLRQAWQVDNRAFSGRSTKSFIDEGRWARLLADIKPGDFVFIQFGHNDMKSEDPSRYADPEGAYPANLRRMAAEVASYGAQCVILSSVARRHFGEDGCLVDTLAPYHKAARATALELALPYIDAHAITTAWINRLGDEASKAFFVHTLPGEYPAYPKGSVDNTHFRHEGAKEVARLIAQAAKTIKGLEEAFIL